MSCVLRAIGRSFDVDAFLAESELRAEAIFHRDEPQVPGLKDAVTPSASGFNLSVGEHGFHDLALQVRDASRFLNEHEDELRRLGAFPGVEEVCLDFGIARKDVAMQSEVFPADLLWQAGALDIDLVVTHYAVAGEES